MIKLLSSSLIFAVSIFAYGAQASDYSNSAVLAAEPDIALVCPDLVLTAAQKAELKTVKDAHKLKVVEGKSALKTARLALETAFADPAANEELIIAKQTALKSAIDTMIDARFALADQIIFKVLTKEQRLPGVTCLQKVKAMHKKEMLERKCKALPPTPNEDESESGLEE
jgi:Spy/CpxP family protein refolding chaperone